MDLGNFIDTLNERQLPDNNNDEEMADAKGSTKKALRSGVRIGDLDLWQEMIDIFNANKNFEGDAFSVKEARRLLEMVKDFNREKAESPKKDKKDDSDYDEDLDPEKRAAVKKEMRGMAIGFSKLGPNIDKALETLEKKEKNKQISKDERNNFDNVMDRISYSLFNVRFLTKLTRTEKSEQSMQGWIEAFPVKYTMKNGDDIYGIIYYRNGIVCWEDMARNSLKKKDEKENIPDSIMRIESDKEVSMPKVFPLSKTNDSNTLLTGAPAIRKVVESGRFKFDDSDSAKEAVKELFFKNGVKLGSNGKLSQGETSGALKTISFWKGIRDILDGKKE